MLCVRLCTLTVSISQCARRISESLELERYLKAQHEKAEQDRAADFEAKDEKYSRFWRYTGAPHIPPPLEVDKSKLQTAGLLHHQDILETVHAQYRRDYLDPLKHKEFSGGSEAPHYLAQTAANKNRAQTRADMISKCKKAIAEGSAFKWHTLSPEKLRAELKASRDREIPNRKRMNGVVNHSFCQGDFHLELLNRMNPETHCNVVPTAIPYLCRTVSSRPRALIDCRKTLHRLCRC